MGRINCCRAFIPEGTPLCRFRESEIYRFNWRSSFNGDAVVHIARRDDAAVLHWERWFARSKAPRNLILPATGWRRLQDAIEAAGFWSLEPHGEMLGFDGAFWTIEGRRGRDYHAVERWSPGDGPIYALGRAFFELAGSPLAEIELY